MLDLVRIARSPNCLFIVAAYHTARALASSQPFVCAGEIYPLADAVEAIIASNQPARGGKVLIKG